MPGQRRTPSIGVDKLFAVFEPAAHSQSIIFITVSKPGYPFLSNGNGVSGVALDDGSEIGCEMVCIGKGVYPNVDFIEPAGIRVDRAVVVDRYTRCSAADVCAAGDVAPIKAHIIEHTLHYGHFMRH